MQRHQLLISTVLFLMFSANVNAQMPAKTKASKQTNVQPNMADAPAAAPTTVVPQPSYGGQPVLQFNTLGKPAQTDDRGMIQFKVPGNDTATTNPNTDKMANPVENIKNDAPYSVALGYPRWEVNLAYNPSSTGFKQDNNTLGTLNYTSTSTTGLDLSAKLIPNPEVFYQISYNYQTIGVNAASLAGGLFVIKESKAAVDSFLVGGGYCFIFNNFYNKLCPGFELGIDSYPSLDFTDNTNIQIAKIRDMVAGINLNWQYPLIYNIKFQSKLGYLSGLKIGQSSNLGVTKNTKLTFDAGFEWPVGTNKHITAMVNYVNRDASVEGKSGANTDTWTTQAAMLAGKIGFAWEFDSGIK